MFKIFRPQKHNIDSKIIDNSRTKTSNLCQYKNCYESKIDNNQYCINHICIYTGCINPVIKSKFCKKHISYKCHVKDCHKEKFHKCYLRINPIYCLDHMCKHLNYASKTCFRQGIKDAKGGQLCARHRKTQGICKIDDCGETKEKKYDYCFRHKCYQEECKNPIVFRNYCNLYCKKHKAHFKVGNSNCLKCSLESKELFQKKA